jgi:hypothetical protein
MLDQISREPGVPTHQAVRSVIIVAREYQDLWRSLAHEFKDAAQVEVLLDRRHGERRAPSVSVAYDRRARERRSLPRAEEDDDAGQDVLVRLHYWRLPD